MYSFLIVASPLSANALIATTVMSYGTPASKLVMTAVVSVTVMFSDVEDGVHVTR